MRVFLELLPVCVCISFPFGFEVEMWDLVVLIPGPGCSKLTTSIINVSLKFQTSKTEICVFLELLPVCVCISFPFGSEVKMWDLVVLIPGPGCSKLTN